VNRTVQGRTQAADIDVGLRAHMQRVFSLMGGGLAVTGLVAYFVAQSPSLLEFFFASPLAYVVMLAPLGFVLAISFGINKMRASTVQTLFWAYSGVMGLSMAAIFLVFTHQSIALTFFVTSAMFLATALYGYTTKRDLTGVGSFLFMGMIGLLIAMVVNIFVGSSALQWAISVAGVFIFTGLVAFHTQSIKEEYQAGDDAEIGSKKAIFGALRLYIAFVNLFMFLLQLIGDRR
jgi:FtsH-binding integral membrane protein